MSSKNARDNTIIESLLEVRRVTKVSKGGRRFAFGALVVAGDGEGRVGYARRKAKEVSDAREKASKAARRDMLRRKIPLYQGRTIHHDTFGRAGASSVMLKKAPPGTGIIAGGSMRALCHMVGIKDVVAKSLGSANVSNVEEATLRALLKLSSPRSIAERRGKKVNQLSV